MQHIYSPLHILVISIYVHNLLNGPVKLHVFITINSITTNRTPYISCSQLASVYHFLISGRANKYRSALYENKYVLYTVT